VTVLERERGANAASQTERERAGFVSTTSTEDTGQATLHGYPWCI
jgi:hypothetical protein